MYRGTVELNDDSSAARLVNLLEALADSGAGASEGVSVSDLARKLGRDKSSVSRLLKGLVSLGLVEKNSQGGHFLGWRLFTIAARAGDQRLLLNSPPVMRQIARQTGERVHLSLRLHDEVLTVLTEGHQRAIGAVGWVGRTIPILGGSSGRALMFDDSEAEIAAIFEASRGLVLGPNFPETLGEVLQRVYQARQLGYAVVEDEFEEGLSAVAAPIRDRSGRIVAALNISAPSFRIKGRLNELAELIRAGAGHLSRSLASPSQTQTPERVGRGVSSAAHFEKSEKSA